MSSSTLAVAIASMAPHQGLHHPSPVATATENAFYVSPSGNDGWVGSETHPFATLERARSAMAASSRRSALLEAGTYVLHRPLVLTAADAGDTFTSAPGQDAVLDGGRTVSPLVSLLGARGILFRNLTFEHSSGTGVFLSGSSGNTIAANRFIDNGTGLVLAARSSRNVVSANIFLNSGLSAIEVKDGSNGNVFDSNEVNGAGAHDTTGGGFFLHGVSYNRISHNLVGNTAGMGIGVLNWDDRTINIGNVVTENLVIDTNKNSSDSGAIYVLGRSQINTQMSISNNLVAESGSALKHSVGIYLDDSTSGVTVEGNILRHVGSDAIQIHGGSNNSIRNNILDLGSGKCSGILFDAAPADTHPSNAQINNIVARNIFYSSSASPRIFFWIEGGSPVIAGNLYYNTTGTAMTTMRPTLDTHPYFGNPLFKDPKNGNYALQAGTAASLINFARIDQAAMGVHPATAH